MSDTSCFEEGNTIVQDCADLYPVVMKVKCENKFCLKVGGVFFPILRQASPKNFSQKQNWKQLFALLLRAGAFTVGKHKHLSLKTG